MGAIAWTRAHLPHRREQAHAGHHHWRGWEIATVFAAGYVLLWAVLMIAARGPFGMGTGHALGFAFGVASYVLLLSAFIAGLAWSVGGARMDRPDRR